MADGFHLLRPELLWVLGYLPGGRAGTVVSARASGRLEPGDRRGTYYPTCCPTRREQLPDAPAYGYQSFLLGVAILAAAGPSLQRVELPVIKRADALVIVLDMSASMLAADVQPSRDPAGATKGVGSA